METPQGCWVLDYKSDRGADQAQGFQSHWPQLWHYAQGVDQSPQGPVLGVGIVWLHTGTVMLLPLPGTPPKRKIITKPKVIKAPPKVIKPKPKPKPKPIKTKPT